MVIPDLFYISVKYYRQVAQRVQVCHDPFCIRLEKEKANDSEQTESQEVEVAIGKIPLAILTKRT